MPSALSELMLALLDIENNMLWRRSEREMRTMALESVPQAGDWLFRLTGGAIPLPQGAWWCPTRRNPLQTQLAEFLQASEWAEEQALYDQCCWRAPFGVIEKERRRVRRQSLDLAGRDLLDDPDAPQVDLPSTIVAASRLWRGEGEVLASRSGCGARSATGRRQERCLRRDGARRGWRKRPGGRTNSTS